MLLQGYNAKGGRGRITQASERAAVSSQNQVTTRIVLDGVWTHWQVLIILLLSDKPSEYFKIILFNISLDILLTSFSHTTTYFC